MDFLNSIFTFFEDFLGSFTQLSNWLVTKHSFAGGLYSFTPIYMLGVGGLITYLGVAVVKWILL